MPLKERETQTRDKYDMSAEEWLAHSGGRDRACFWPEGMLGFLRELKGDKLVLEVGSGPATDGEYLQEAHATVFSTDYSTMMLKIAKDINAKGRFALMDMNYVGFPDNKFDGFWATACLLHLENPDKALGELTRVTKNDGVGFISIKEGEGEEIDPRTGYYFHYYHNGDFMRKLRDVGLDTISSGRKAGSPKHDYLTYLVKVAK